MIEGKLKKTNIYTILIGCIHKISFATIKYSFFDHAIFLTVNSSNSGTPAVPVGILHQFYS